MPIYTVTEKAGPVIARNRVKAGDELDLSEAQAQHDVLQGALVAKGGTLHEAYTNASQEMDALRVEAAAFKARRPMPTVAVDRPVEAPAKAKGVAKPVEKTAEAQPADTKPPETKPFPEPSSNSF